MESAPEPRASALEKPTGRDPQQRLSEAEDTLRAIGAGEVDGFIVKDDGGQPQVFTLATADRPYRMFVENMRDGAATVSSSGLVLYANRRLAELVGRSREAIVGSALAAIVAREATLDLREMFSPDGLTVELELVDQGGNPVPVLAGGSPLQVGSERVICVTFTDLRLQKAHEREIAQLNSIQAARLTDLQDAQAALTEQATHDALTGLPNRALLVDRIDQALAHARRSGEQTAVLFLDLDRFKQINDTWGHATGDAVLRSVADKLAAVVRPMDTVARIGGDEFAILAPNVGSGSHADELKARLVAALQRPAGRNLHEGESIGASVGIAVSAGGHGSAEDLLHEADIAMYKVKARGDGRFGTPVERA